MNPVIVELGPFQLHWYGVFIVGGAVIAAWLSSLYAARAGENPDHIWNILAWSLIGGIIGARIYHVLSSPADGFGWAYYRENPLDIINFWNGGFRGLGIYGGLVGGVLAIVIYCRVNKLNWLRYLDFIAPNVLLAQAIGRMGNFVNQELFGPPTTLPWAFYIDPRYPCQPVVRPEGIQSCGSLNLTPETLEWYAANGFHPTFFYEALWNLAMFVVLALIINRYGERLRRGDAVLLYLIAYPLGRFWVELFRPDAWVIGQLATAQWIALGCVLASTFLLIMRHRNWSWQEHPEESLADMSGRRTVVSAPPANSTQVGNL
jgi:phosphatidylglycerol:prolipoprotein diacylglycerol transferase